MARYPLGQPIHVTTTVTNDLGVLVTAGALTLLVKVFNADGTTTTTGTYASPTEDSTGVYHQDVPATDLTILGHYQYTWTATGTGAGVSFGSFDVFDPFEVSFLPIADALLALKIPAAQQTPAVVADVAQYVQTIEGSLQGLTGGPLANTTISERAVLTADYTVLQVRQRPLVSVTSIQSIASGEDIDISAGLDIDTNAGTIRRQLGYPFYGPYFVWLPAMLVTYVAGWGAIPPPAFNTAGRIILQNLWNTQHGPAVRPSMGAADQLVTMPGFGYLIPSQAAEILKGTFNGMPFMLEAYV